MRIQFQIYFLGLFLLTKFSIAQSNIQLANEAFSKGNYQLAEDFLSQEIQSKPSGIAYYNRGLTRLAKEDYFKSINDFDSAIALTYKVHDAYNRRGFANYHIKNYPSAIQDFQRVIQMSNQSELLAYAYRFISLSYIRSQDFIQAEEWCNKGLESFPSDKNLLFNRGFISYSTKKYAKAINEFDQRLAISPNHVETLLWKAEALVQNDNLQEAQKVLEKVIAIQPNQLIALSQLAVVYQKTKQKEQFKSTLKTLNSLGYQADFLEVNLAKSHMEEGNLDEALVLLNKSIDKNKRNATALLNRSYIHYRRKDYQAAMRDAKLATEIDPNSYDAKNQLLQCLIEMKDPQMVSLAQEHQKLYNQKPEATYLLGKAYFQMNNYSDAAKSLESTLPGFSGSQTYSMLAFIYSQKLVDEEKFKLYAEKAQKENPNGKNVALLESYSNLNEKKYDLAIEGFKKYLEKNGDDAMVISNLAYCYEQTKQLLEAKSLRLKNTQIQPNNGKAFYQLGNVCYKLNDYPAANAALIQAIKLTPNYYPAYLLKGVVSLALQDYGTGKKDLEVALKNLPEKASDIYPNLAFAAAKLGDLNDALPYLTEWEKMEPQNGLIFYTRGNLYASKGNYEKALENYSKAIDLDPNNADFLLNRAILNINNSHYQDAILDGERILLLNQKTAEVYYNLGVAYIKDGTQLSKGCEAIKTAKRMGYPQAEQWLSKCD